MKTASLVSVRRFSISGFVLGLVFGWTPGRALAWYYPEHRDITAAAIETLGPVGQASLSGLLEEARGGDWDRLCATLADKANGDDPTCVDVAALPALAGDHSCSPRELAEKVLPGPWVLAVARVGQETKKNLAAASTEYARLNAMARSNLELQVVDPEYATRAGANHAHFLLPRVEDDFNEYVRLAAREGTSLNALGLYIQYHVAALSFAHGYAELPPNAERRVPLARLILLTEAYALHWLEDIYAAGHVVGTWGDAAWRKGTHDYYSQFGLDFVTWDGKHVILFGDGNMKSADLRRTSAAVSTSLQQLADALRPGDGLAALASAAIPDPQAIFAFDSCQEETQPRVRIEEELWAELGSQLRTMPVPTRGEGDVHPARFREELGPFLGVFASATAALRWGGFGPEAPQWFGALAVGLRFGYGAESLTGSTGTALAWLEVGVAMQSAQTYPCGGSPQCAVYDFFPTIPARTGFRVGGRLPFYVIPGDLLILGPALALASPSALSTVGVAAANGGLIPYERRFDIGLGTLQVVAGRTMDATFFGLLTSTSILVPITPIYQPTDTVGIVELKSVQLNFPVLEWVPFKTFATQLVFSSPIQLGFGVELPMSSPVVAPPGYPPASLGPAWSVFVRATFEGRYFFGSREDRVPPSR